MKKFDKSTMVILGIFAVALAISWNLYFKQYLQKDTVSIFNFPETMGEWSGENIPLAETDYEILETKNTFVRRYKTTDGKEIFLFIVYSQNNRKVSHPPEICYTGGGVSVLEHAVDPITVSSANLVIDANRLLLEKGQDRQVAYYWFKVGDTFTGSYWKQQMLIAFKTILGRPASSALIRVSSTVVKDDKAESVKTVKEFSDLIVPALFQFLP